MSSNKIRKFSSIVSITLILCMLVSVLPPSVFGATAIQEPVTKDGAKYADIITSAGNSSANLGDKITANGAKYDITLDGEKVGNFVFNKNNQYIEITVTKDVLIEVVWSCSSKYANCILSGEGIYKIPQLLQDNGKTQNFDAIWVTNVRELTKFDDSDNDGLPDWLEKLYNMNPNNPDTLGDGILDGDRIFEYTAVCEDSKATDSVIPSLVINLKGKLINSLEIWKIGNNDIFLNPEMAGYIGNAFDFYLDGEFESATLTFEFDASLLNDPNFVPTIYYWNSEIQFLEELPNQIINENKVSTQITHFSEYVLLDKTGREYELLHFEILPPVDGELQNKRFDLVLVLDESGSISTSDFNLMKDLTASLVRNLGDDDRISVYTFDNTIRRISGFTDKDSAETFVRGLTKHSGNTAIYTALRDAINEIINNPSEDASKIIVLLTDGQNNAGITNPDTVYPLAVANNIAVYTIGVGSVNTAVLTNIATATGGAYYGAANFDQLAPIFARWRDDVDLYRDSDDDGISDYHEKLIALGTLKMGSGAPLKDYYKMDYLNSDSDGDGLLDGDELEIKCYSLTIGNLEIPIYYAYMYSNPCVADTDGDGLTDDSDPKPLSYNITDNTLAFANGLAYNNLKNKVGYTIGDLESEGFQFNSISAKGISCLRDAEIIYANDADAGFWHDIGSTLWGDFGLGTVALKIHRYGERDAIIYAIRGTENHWDWEGINDWANNIALGLLGDSPQSKHVFNEWKMITKDNGGNVDYYIAGHSLGGRLAQDVVRKTYDANLLNPFYKIPTPKHVATFNALGYNFVQSISLLPINVLEVYRETITNFYYEHDRVGSTLGTPPLFGRIGKDAVPISRGDGLSPSWPGDDEYHGIYENFDDLYSKYSWWIN